MNIKVKEETKRDRRIGVQEEQGLLAAALAMSCAEHKYVGSAMHDRIIGALETCCRQGEMLRIQNRHIDWEKHQIAIPAKHAKDAAVRSGGSHMDWRGFAPVEIIYKGREMSA